MGSVLVYRCRPSDIAMENTGKTSSRGLPSSCGLRLPNGSLCGRYQSHAYVRNDTTLPISGCERSKYTTSTTAPSVYCEDGNCVEAHVCSDVLVLVDPVGW